MTEETIREIIQDETKGLRADVGEIQEQVGLIQTELAALHTGVSKLAVMVRDSFKTLVMILETMATKEDMEDVRGDLVGIRDELLGAIQEERTWPKEPWQSD